MEKDCVSPVDKPDAESVTAEAKKEQSQPDLSGYHFELPALSFGGGLAREMSPGLQVYLHPFRRS